MLTLENVETKKRPDSIDTYFKAADFLSIGQIRLKTNPLQREPLKTEHIKSRLLRHFGAAPGLEPYLGSFKSFYSRYPSQISLCDRFWAWRTCSSSECFLEGIMTEVYPETPMSTAGIEKLMKEFSWSGGLPNHVSPHTPGSIHEKDIDIPEVTDWKWNL